MTLLYNKDKHGPFFMKKAMHLTLPTVVFSQLELILFSVKDLFPTKPGSKRFCDRYAYGPVKHIRPEC
jgi:hypothetical protein